MTDALKLLRGKREGRWYESGLQFRCKAPECSHCCSGQRGEGYVWLNAEEMTAIAAHLGVPFDKFTRKYVRQVGLAYSLVEKLNKDCVFLEAGKCSIYEVRPTQCRTYPFWPAIVRAPQTWAKETAQCPGIGQGEIIDAQEIDRQRDLDIEERRRMGVE